MDRDMGSFCVSMPVLSILDEFVPQYFHVIRCLNTDSNIPARKLDDVNVDVPSNLNSLKQLALQYEHFRSLKNSWRRQLACQQALKRKEQQGPSPRLPVVASHGTLDNSIRLVKSDCKKKHPEFSGCLRCVRQVI
jgi:hypothetical protein